VITSSDFYCISFTNRPSVCLSVRLSV